jgi:hypothetical protein
MKIMSKRIEWFIRRPKPEPDPTYEELVGLLSRRTADVNRLNREVEMLRKDAERYRFLRGKSRFDLYEVGLELDWYARTENLNELVDAAMKEPK